MLTIIFFAALIWVTFKLFVLGIKAAWGIAKVICTVLLFPSFIVGLCLVGLISVAVPILIVVGIVILILNASLA